MIDVFWRGSADDHLWHGQFLPGSGWNGPQGLGGELASAPSPVVSAPGTTTVLWKGATRACGASRAATRPLVGAAQPRNGPARRPAAGDRAAGRRHPGLLARLGQLLRLGGLLPAGDRLARAAGPRRPGPVGALAGDRGRHRAGAVARARSQADYIRHRRGRRWNLAEWQGPVPLPASWLGSAPFAAVGSPGAALQVFWAGRRNGSGRPRSGQAAGRGRSGLPDRAGYQPIGLADRRQSMVGTIASGLTRWAKRLVISNSDSISVSESRCGSRPRSTRPECTTL